MILKGAEIARYLARPDPTRPALLIWGQDGMRVALKRQEALKAMLGEGAEEEMRLTRISGAELRRDPAALLDAVKAVGFFPGPRAVFIDEATDGNAPTFRTALDAWAKGDAIIVLTAGALGKSSALRKVVERHKTAVGAPIYDDPPGQAEIEGWLKEAGLTDIPTHAMEDLVALSRALDPGDFRQTVEKIALYKLGDPSPLSGAEIEALAPTTFEADIDQAVEAAADGDTKRLVVMMRRIEAQGIAPVTVAIATLRHFRALHAASCDPGGPGAGLARMRPPVFGPRRDRMTRQARTWGTQPLEDALHRLVETDLALRSSTRAPAMALMERALMRLSMMPRGR